MARFTVNVDDKFDKTLAGLANGSSKADVIQRAVSSYQYLISEIPNRNSDKRISITDAAKMYCTM